MKLNVFVGKSEEKRVDIYIHKKRQIIDDTENLLNRKREIFGYKNDEIRKLDFSKISRLPLFIPLSD